MSLASAVAAPGPGDRRMWAVGRVLEVDGGAARLRVRVDGGQAWLPHVAGTYTVDDSVVVLRDPVAGQVVLGQIGALAAEEVLDTSTGSGVEVATVLVRPTWSGTWRVDRSAWGRWTTIASSDLTDLYQGSGSGSGTLYGLAVYGAQLSGLGATSVLRARVHLIHNGSGYGATTFTVRPTAASSQPAGAPTFAGDTVVSASIGPGGRTTVDLPASVATGLGDGTYGSLGLVGAGYGGVRGANHPEGMAVEFTFERET